MSREIYEVYAVKYATRDGMRSANFIGGDPHDAPMPMDYFVWLIRNAERTFVVDPMDPDTPTVTFGAFDAAGRPRVLYDMLRGLPRLDTAA